MGDIFKQLIDLIRDKTTSWGFKSALFISILGLVFIADYSIGFSYNYHLNNKFSQIESIQSMKKIYKNDSIALVQVNTIEKKVLNKKHYTEFFTSVLAKDSINASKNNVFEENPIEMVNSKKKTRSFFWMLLSSNYSLIIGFFLLLYLPITGPVHRTGGNLLGWFASLIVMCFIIAFITWVAYLIPLIYDTVYLNYILNVVLHLPVAFFINWFLRGK